MTLERLFSAGGDVVLAVWLLLMFAPRWRWTQRLATMAVPLLIAGLYVWLLVHARPPKGVGFGSLEQVRLLFSAPEALLAE